MRFILRLLGWLFTLAVLAVAGLALMLYLDSRPLVPEARALGPAERTWAREWLRSASPRGMQDGERATLTLSEDEATVLAIYLLGKVGEGRAAVRLERDRARIAASLGLPWDPRRSFLNAELEVAEASGRPQVRAARLAGVPLPAALAETLAGRLMGGLEETGLLENLDIEPDLALLTYRWDRGAAEQLTGGLLAGPDLDSVLHYQALLARYGAQQPKGTDIPLADVLSDLLFEARYRSSGQGPEAAIGSDPAAENRAVLLALAAYANRRPVRGADGASAIRPADFRSLTLRGRRDLAQHFLVSAALAAQGGDVIADLVGLFKEVQDADGGSGFSFPDLAADRAGTRFAELATAGPDAARAVQAAAQGGLAEDDFMPVITGLPEGLAQAAFQRTYGDTGSAAYRRVADEIERRIDATTLQDPAFVSEMGQRRGG